MTLAATLTRGTPVAFATKGTVREARGLASMTNTCPEPLDALHGILHIDEADHFQPFGDPAGVFLEGGHGGLGEVDRREA